MDSAGSKDIDETDGSNCSSVKKAGAASIVSVLSTKNTLVTKASRDLCSQANSQNLTESQSASAGKKLAPENRCKLIQDRREQEKLRLLNEIKMSEEKAEKTRRLVEEERQRKATVACERERRRIAAAAERRRQHQQLQQQVKTVNDTLSSTVVSAATSTKNVMTAKNLMTTSMIVTSPATNRMTSSPRPPKSAGYAFGSSTPRGLTFSANGQAIRPKTSLDNLTSVAAQSTIRPAPTMSDRPAGRPATAAVNKTLVDKATKRNVDRMSASMYIPCQKPNAAAAAGRKTDAGSCTIKKRIPNAGPPAVIQNETKGNKPALEKLKADSSRVTKPIASKPEQGDTKLEPTQPQPVDLPNSARTPAELYTEHQQPPEVCDTKADQPVVVQPDHDPTSGGELAPQEDSADNGLQANNKKGSTMTADEAKTALAERRRLAREQAEREKEAERIRIEQQRLAEEEEFRRQEEEELRLLREAQELEKQRLIEAQELHRLKMEEEKNKAEQERQKLLEIDQKNKELALKADKEREEKIKRDETDRLERKKKLESIRRRTQIHQSSSSNCALNDGGQTLATSASSNSVAPPSTSQSSSSSSSSSDSIPLAAAALDHASPSRPLSNGDPVSGVAPPRSSQASTELLADGQRQISNHVTTSAEIVNSVLSPADTFTSLMSSHLSAALRNGPATGHRQSPSTTDRDDADVNSSQFVGRSSAPDPTTSESSTADDVIGDLSFRDNNNVTNNNNIVNNDTDQSLFASGTSRPVESGDDLMNANFSFQATSDTLKNSVTTLQTKKPENLHTTLDSGASLHSAATDDVQKLIDF